MKVKLFTLLTTLLLSAASAWAQPYPAESYRLSEDGKTLEEWLGTETAIDMTKDSKLNGVTTIGDGAFWNNSNLTSIVLPTGLKTIDGWAFLSCEKLSSINLPEGLTSIGEFAFCQSGLTSIAFPSTLTSIGGHTFSECNGITSVTLPKGLTTIDAFAFYDCQNLTAFSVSQDNPNFKANSGILFSKDNTKLVIYPAAKADNTYSIPEGVTTIAVTAFAGCGNLTTITIPSSVTTIDKWPFIACPKLSSIIVGPSSQSFVSKEGVLYSKDNSNLVAYPPAKPNTEYAITEGVTNIETGAFILCEKLTSITLPSSLQKIGEEAFIMCNGLTAITIPKEVTTIDIEAFHQCEKLITVNATAATKLTSSNGFRKVFNNAEGITIYVATETIKNLFIGYTDTKIEVPSPLYTVEFNVIGQGMLTAKAKNASFTSGATIPSDWDVAFAATGGKVKAWTITGGTLTGTDTDANRAITNLSSNAIVTVEFEQVFRTVTYSVVGNVGGTLSAKVNDASISSNAQINDGGSVTFTATPADGYKLKAWTATGAMLSGSNTDATRSIAALTSDATVTVEFEKITHSASFSVLGSTGGSLTAKANGSSIASGAQVEEGSSIDFTATPADGYRVKAWTATGTTLSGSNTDATRSIAALTSDATISVEFEKTTTGVEPTTQNTTAVRTNPFITEITVDNAAQVTRYTVMNMLGQPQLSGENNGATTLTIESTTLPKGVYLLVLQTSNGKKNTIRVVKSE